MRKNLAELDIEGPWTFELINPIKRHLKTHAGVLEFTADEGVVYLPSWVGSSSYSHYEDINADCLRFLLSDDEATRAV